MKQEQLIDKGYYITQGRNAGYVFQYNKDEILTAYLQTSNREFNVYGSLVNNNSFKDYAEATQEQIDWFKECFKQKRFVELKEVRKTESYPIF